MKQFVITRAPLRVSFVGGGSDLPDPDGNGIGRTISTAINKHVYVFARRRTDHRVIVHWREKEDVESTAHLKHDLIREVLKMEGMWNGVEIATFADVPGVGSGLGSSSATTCAVYAAVMCLKGYDLDSEDVALAAVEVEKNRLGRLCGCQDHYASAIGGMLDLNHDQGLVTSWKYLKFDDNRLKRLSERFALFSPRDRTGRNSDKILGDRSNGKDWRDLCLLLCKDFVAGWSVEDYETLQMIVSSHHEIKRKEFPSYIDSDVEKELEETKLPYKLCGAGGTGHLLVGVSAEFRIPEVQSIEAIWGPELPWAPTHKGTEIIHAE